MLQSTTFSPLLQNEIVVTSLVLVTETQTTIEGCLIIDTEGRHK